MTLRGSLWRASVGAVSFIGFVSVLVGTCGVLLLSKHSQTSSFCVLYQCSRRPTSWRCSSMTNCCHWNRHEVAGSNLSRCQWRNFWISMLWSADQSNWSCSNRPTLVWCWPQRPLGRPYIFPRWLRFWFWPCMFGVFSLSGNRSIFCWRLVPLISVRFCWRLCTHVDWSSGSNTEESWKWWAWGR